MTIAVYRALALPIVAILLVASPALAGGKGGDGPGNGQGHAFGHDQGHAYGHDKGHGKGGGGDGSKGTPAPVAGLGILALGAIGYGSRKLRKPPPK